MERCIGQDLMQVKSPCLETRGSASKSWCVCLCVARVIKRGVGVGLGVGEWRRKTDIERKGGGSGVGGVRECENRNI